MTTFKQMAIHAAVESLEAGYKFFKDCEDGNITPDPGEVLFISTTMTTCIDYLRITYTDLDKRRVLDVETRDC